MAVLSPLLLAAAAPEAASCNPIPGWDQVLADEGKRIVIVGEMHGTNETPALFADAVCLTARSRPVMVALEQPAADQPAIDAYMASDGGADARAALLRAAMWHGPMKDGRSSEAIFRLFETLRRMRAAGTIEGVIAFQPQALAREATRGDYEKAMADIVLAGTEGGATVLALVGNVHAMLTEVTFRETYKPMAALLPTDRAVSLFVPPTGGEHWACMGGPCGPQPMRDSTGGRARGVELGEAGRGLYSGVIYLGAPMSVSAPQPAG